MIGRGRIGRGFTRSDRITRVATVAFPLRCGVSFMTILVIEFVGCYSRDGYRMDYILGGEHYSKVRKGRGWRGGVHLRAGRPCVLVVRNGFEFLFG